MNKAANLLNEYAIVKQLRFSAIRMKLVIICNLASDMQSFRNVRFDYEYFIELSPMLVGIVGYDGCLKKINPAVLKTFGYTAEEMLQQPLSNFVYPEDRVATKGVIADAIRGQTIPLFENRCVKKSKAVFSLTWTLVSVPRDRLIFLTAQELLARNHVPSSGKLNYLPLQQLSVRTEQAEASSAEQIWLQQFEALVRANLRSNRLNVGLLADGLAMSERNLFREVKALLGISPHHLVRMIRLQVAWEAISSGKYRTVAEVSNFAGFKTSAYFNRLFKQVYGINVLELL